MRWDGLKQFVMNMWAAIMFGLICICCILMSSCKSKEYIPIETVRTEYKDVYHAIHDTTIEKDSVFFAVKGDTVVKEKYKYVYKYLFKTDTISIVKNDSIMVPYPVEKKLSRWQQIKLDYLSELALILLAAIVVYLVVKYYTKR